MTGGTWLAVVFSTRTTRGQQCTEVVKWLETEFAHVTGSKDTALRGMAPRTRCIRYMGELAKFRCDL